MYLHMYGFMGWSGGSGGFWGEHLEGDQEMGGAVVVRVCCVLVVGWYVWSICKDLGVRCVDSV